jgi:hypothetical protein
MRKALETGPFVLAVGEARNRWSNEWSNKAGLGEGAGASVRITEGYPWMIFTTGPRTFRFGTPPHTRESHDSARLSPITK